MHSLSRAAIASAIVLAGCGSGDDARRDAGTGAGDGGGASDGGGRDGSAGDGGSERDSSPVGPPVGTLEAFADLGGPSDSVALARTEDALYVSLPEADAVVRVAADGTVSPLATVPAARGIAVDGAGDLIVAGAAAAGGPGALWRVSSDGATARAIVSGDAMGAPLTTLDSVAIAPGGEIVFDDAVRYLILRAAADGTNVRTVTGAIAAPTGLAFWKDATELLAASWTADVVFVVPYDRAAGTFEGPRPHQDAAGIEGIALAAGGDAILISTDVGVLRLPAAGGPPVTIHDASGLGSPAGGTFGAGALVAGWLYLTDLGGPTLRRVWIGEAGAPLPAP